MSENAALGERVQGIVADRLHVDSDAVSAKTEFAGETLDADSLDLVEVAEAIDDELDVYVPDRALSEVDTVSDLTDAVRSHRE
jgi:acyl carrier protein